MSKSLPIDSNSRPIPAFKIGFGQTFTPGLVDVDFGNEIVRFKAIGDTKFRLDSNPASEIIILDGETEYFVVPINEKIYIISGSLNVMY